MYETPRPTREQYIRRDRLADELLRRVEATGDTLIARHGMTGAGRPFGDEAAVLTHLAARWSRNLAGSLDPVLDLPPPDRERAAADVAARLAIRRPALHAVLQRYAEHPAVSLARDTDRARAGLVSAPVQGAHVAPRTSAPTAPRDCCGVLGRLRKFGRAPVRSTLRTGRAVGRYTPAA